MELVWLLCGAFVGLLWVTDLGFVQSFQRGTLFPELFQALGVWYVVLTLWRPVGRYAWRHIKARRVKAE